MGNNDWIIAVILACLIAGVTAGCSYEAYHDYLLSRRGRIFFSSAFALFGVAATAFAIFVAVYRSGN